MGESAGLKASVLDDRASFSVAEAVVRTIMRLAPELPTEDAVWEAFAGPRDRGLVEYLGTVRHARHSIFFYQLQQLYEFGQERARPEHRERFCFECGLEFLEIFFDENIQPFLKVAHASPGALQITIVEMLQSHLYRLSGNKYEMRDEIRDEEILVGLEYRLPEQMEAYLRRYLQRYGLEAERCFENSFGFIAGVFQGFLKKIVAGFDASGFSARCEKGRGQMHLPVGRAARFDYGALIATLMGHIRELDRRRRAAQEGERREHDLIVDSEVMRRTWDRVRRASRSDELVLLQGESGTGKSFIASKIHELSARRDQPYVEVSLVSDVGSDNMIQSDLFGHQRGAFTGATEHKKGLFSLADSGTIFLDEIGDASAELQAKLLRVIEGKVFKPLGSVEDVSVDVRVIAATNRDLEAMVKEGTFREDLYYRLNVITIELPPLRERPGDLPALANFLLARAAARGAGSKRLTAALAGCLTSYHWPGNVRELDHALRHAVAMAEGDGIGPEHLPDTVRRHLAAGTVMEAQPAESPQPPRGEEAPRIIDVDALRRAIRSSDAATLGAPGKAQVNPAHISHAKRTYLAELIDEFGGDLALIGCFWDRSSAKTLRKLIREYGLTERLQTARARKRRDT
jgi:DNA-binding NtrC family response regulator